MQAFVDDELVPIKYNPIFREYSLDLGYPLEQNIMACPWCATRLAQSLRDEFFNVLANEYHIDDSVLTVFDNPALPKEFKSDLWWKKEF